MTTMTGIRLGTAIAALLVLAMSGCTSVDTNGGESGDIDGRLTVFAAASLTETFTELGNRFEDEHPGVEVKFSFGGSSTLAQQIEQGAPADVFASAAPKNMQQVVDAAAVTAEPVTFVRNHLAIAVPAGNPAGITGLADFARAEHRLALCAEQVPCGAAAQQVFASAGITPQPDTRERDVKAALTKVTLGEVDAALVYRSDVHAAGDAVAGIDFPESDRVTNDYPIAPLAEAPNAATAAAFVDFIGSPAARPVFTEAGFDAP